MAHQLCGAATVCGCISQDEFQWKCHAKVRHHHDFIFLSFFFQTEPIYEPYTSLCVIKCLGLLITVEIFLCT